MDSKKAINEYKKLLDDNTKYSLTGQMDIVSNEELYHYDVKVDYMEGDYYKASLVNKDNEHEQIILKNKSGVYVVTPALNKSFKFQSTWPNNNSQVYLLGSLVTDLKNDNNYNFTQKDNDYIFQTKTNYPNNPKYTKQNIILDKNYNLKKIEVQDDQNISYIEFKVENIDKKAKRKIIPRKYMTSTLKK